MASSLLQHALAQVQEASTSRKRGTHVSWMLGCRRRLQDERDEAGDKAGDKSSLPSPANRIPRAKSHPSALQFTSAFPPGHRAIATVALPGGFSHFKCTPQAF
jgi:hypothetical protein